MPLKCQFWHGNLYNRRITLHHFLNKRIIHYKGLVAVTGNLSTVFHSETCTSTNIQLVTIDIGRRANLKIVVAIIKTRYVCVNKQNKCNYL